MIDNIISEKQEKWNKRFKECLENNNISQASFAKALEKYKDDKSEQSSQPNKIDQTKEPPNKQPTISNWLNVGAKRDGKAPIGFPKFENMIMVADCLGVDIGYLIGETDAETFDLAKASEFMHLEPNALNNFLRVMKGDELSQKYEINEYSTVLNKLLCSKYLDDFIKSLGALEDTYMKYNNMIPNLSELDEMNLQSVYNNYLNAKLSDKYDETILDLALKHQGIIFEEDDPFNLTDKERDAEKEIHTISPYFLDALIKSKSNWQLLREHSFLYLKEIESITKKYGDAFLEKVMLFGAENLNLPEEPKTDIKRLRNANRKFSEFLRSPCALNIYEVIVPLKDIKRISNLYPDTVLERAWEHYKFCEAINDINTAIDENYDFLSKFKGEIGYHRFLVQESLLLLLNDIFPISVDLRNIF